MSDDAKGYDSMAAAYVRSRSRIGYSCVRDWAMSLGAGARVLDAGCGHGVPVTEALLSAGCDVHAIDASQRLVEEFMARFPGVPVACEPVQSSPLFGQSYDGIVTWGLLFLLDPGGQLAVISKLAGALEPAGQLLFTAPWQAGEWHDELTGHLSQSLGADAYRNAIRTAGLTLRRELDDEGGNHYYIAQR